MKVKIISDYSIWRKGKIYSKGETLEISKESAEKLIERGIVRETSKKEKED